MIDSDEVHEILKEIENHLLTVDSVAGTEIKEKRRPERLVITSSTGRIPIEAKDLIDHYNASVLDPEVLDGGLLKFELTVSEQFKHKGTRKLRSDGKSSVSVTIPPEAIDESGLEPGTELRFDARDGEIRITDQ